MIIQPAAAEQTYLYSNDAHYTSMGNEIKYKYAVYPLSCCRVSLSVSVVIKCPPAPHTAVVCISSLNYIYFLKCGVNLFLLVTLSEMQSVGL